MEGRVVIDFRPQQPVEPSPAPSAEKYSLLATSSAQSLAQALPKSANTRALGCS